MDPNLLSVQFVESVLPQIMAVLNIKEMYMVIWVSILHSVSVLYAKTFLISDGH